VEVNACVHGNGGGSGDGVTDIKAAADIRGSDGSVMGMCGGDGSGGSGGRADEDKAAAGGARTERS
jgi:hypothetical protein